MIAIIKPTSACNLACRYCYMAGAADTGRMTNTLLESTMLQVANISPDKRVHFLWHGGEPLLMGVPFFAHAAAISRHLREGGYEVTNGIQSNATLITDELLDFIERERDFKLGLSLDGPQPINDRTRIYPDGTGTFDDIFRGVSLVKQRRLKNKPRNELGGGVIVVVSRSNIGSLNEIYDYFRTHQIDFQLNPLFIAGRATMDFSITPEEYGEACIRIFNRWIDDDSQQANLFGQIMGNILTGCSQGGTCSFSGHCAERFISIGPTGDIYPCGRFNGISDFCLGNIEEPDGLSKALNSETRNRLCHRDPQVNAKCKECAHIKICNAGCMHNAYSAGNIMGADPLCPSYKMVFNHIRNRIESDLINAENSDE